MIKMICEQEGQMARKNEKSKDNERRDNQGDASFKDLG